MLIRSLFCRPRRSARRSRSLTCVPLTGMENLETRALLSAVAGVSADAIASAEPAPVCEITDPEFSVEDGTATLTGTHLADDIDVFNFAGQVIFAISNSNGTTYYSVSESAIDTVVIDALCGADSVEIHSGISESVEINGGQGSDLIVHNGLAGGVLNGNAGDDTILGSASSDLISAGLGNDQIGSGAGFDVVFGGQGNDLIAGGDTSDILLGGDGHDTVYGVGGADLIFGDGLNSLPPNLSIDPAQLEKALLRIGNVGAGNDYIEAGLGNDRVYAGNGSDLVFGDAGDDTVYAGDGSDSVSGGNGNDWLFGMAGRDVMTGDGPNTLADVPVPAGDVDFETYVVRVGEMGRGHDYMEGGDGADLLVSGAGNDLVFGGAGADSLYTGTGADIAVGGDGNDRLFTGAGNDLVFGDGTNSLPETLPKDRTIVREYVHRFSLANSGNDVIFSGAGNDIVLAGVGNDRVDAGAGDDVVLGQSGNDSLDGGDGNDSVYGGDGDDVLIGGDGEDYLDGGAGIDEFFAQDGCADVLCIEAGEVAHIDALLDELIEC